MHCAELSVDGFVYACDRANDRVQVFRKDGTFVKEVFVQKNTKGDGSAWDIAFSKDPQQKYFFLADGANDKIHVFDRASNFSFLNLRADSGVGLRLHVPWFVVRVDYGIPFNPRLGEPRSRLFISIGQAF